MTLPISVGRVLQHPAFSHLKLILFPPLYIVHTIMKYPVVLHKETNSDYGVTVPDIPGCFSAGTGIDDALSSVQEAIYCHLEGMLKDHEPLPQPRDIEFHLANSQHANGIWAYVDIDLSHLNGKFDIPPK